jgi:cobalamin biosynthesis protein CobT
MSNSSRPLGRRELLRVGVGTAATAAAVAQPVYAQENASENTTAENATAENATAENTTAENATAENATAENATAEGAEAEGAAAEGAEAEESTEASAETDGDSVGVLPVFAGVLALGLLSPLIFAVVMKFVYADDATQETTEYRP